MEFLKKFYSLSDVRGLSPQIMSLLKVQRFSLMIGKKNETEKTKKHYVLRVGHGSV
jgi:hypothetical protein